jgi:hypothetical protein
MDSRAETDLLIEEYRGICESFSTVVPNLTTTFNHDLVESTRASADEVVGNFSEREDGLLTEVDKVTIRRAIDVMSGELLLVSVNPIMSTYNKLKKPVRTITKDDEKNFLDLNFGILKEFEEALEEKIKNKKIEPSKLVSSVIEKIKKLGLLKSQGRLTIKNYMELAEPLKEELEQLTQEMGKIILKNKNGYKIKLGSEWTFVIPSKYKNVPAKHRISVLIPPTTDIFEKMLLVSARFPPGTFKYKIPSVVGDIFTCYTRSDPMTIYIQDDNPETISLLRRAIIEIFNLSPDVVIDNPNPTTGDMGRTYQNIKQAHKIALKHFEALRKQYELLCKQQSALEEIESYLPQYTKLHGKSKIELITLEKKEHSAQQSIIDFAWQRFKLLTRQLNLMRNRFQVQQCTLDKMELTLGRDVELHKRRLNELYDQQRANLLAQRLREELHAQQHVDLLTQLREELHVQQHVDLLARKLKELEELKAQQHMDLLARKLKELHAQQRANLLAQQQALEEAESRAKLCVDLLEKVEREYNKGRRLEFEDGHVTNGSSSVGIEDSVHITLQFIQSLNIESSDKELASLSELTEIRERQKEIARRNRMIGVV